jgi:hypothetical protein
MHFTKNSKKKKKSKEKITFLLKKKAKFFQVFSQISVLIWGSYETWRENLEIPQKIFLMAELFILLMKKSWKEIIWIEGKIFSNNFINSILK